MHINATIVAAFANICFGFLGGIAIILVAAILSKSYLLGKSRGMDNITSPGKAVEVLQNIFNYFRIPSFHRIKVNFNATYIDNGSGIVIAVPENGAEFSGLVPHDPDQDCIDFTYQLPQMTKSHSVRSAKIGWRKLFDYEGNTYALTLVSLEPHETVTFDFRRVTSTVKPVD